MKSSISSPKLTRRNFLKGAAGAAASIVIVHPGLVRGAEANSRLEIGLIGCGGRGNWIADLFRRHGGYRFVALADYFADRANEAGRKFEVPENRRYTGLSGYKKLLEQKLDAVVIETPPYFHPEQAAAAVDAGRHVYLAKPIAVDVPGCQTIAQSGKKATAKSLVFLVDFQTRANEFYREALRRVRRGDLGKLIMGEAHYPWRGGGRGTPPATPEEQLRNWYYVLPISGDFIVEQSIHSLDVATWILNADPIHAIGSGGHKVRPKNSIYDHFALQYQFPDDLPLSFTCIQSIPEAKDEISCRVFGSEGVIVTDYYSNVFIRGNEMYEGGNVGNLYTTGTETNIREFHQFITQGKHANETVPASVRSNLTAILGREAAYRRTLLTLAELVREAKKLEPNLSGLQS